MNKRIARATLAVAILFALTGCVVQKPVFMGEPTPKAVRATPTLQPLHEEPGDFIVMPEETNADAAGNEIEGDEHFLQYVSFRNIRVYEYDGGTLMEGICENTYQEALTGAFEIRFFSESDQLVAQAPLYTQDGSGLYQSGETIILAEIDTDTDIQMMRFEITMQQRVWPASMTMTE